MYLTPMTLMFTTILVNRPQCFRRQLFLYIKGYRVVLALLGEDNRHIKPCPLGQVFLPSIPSPTTISVEDTDE